jgi:hypothetical protein
MPQFDKALAKLPLLIIDDFGLKPLRSPDDEDFHDLIAERYERAAIILTNLDFPEWGEAFPGNKMIGVQPLTACVTALTRSSSTARAIPASNRTPKHSEPSSQKEAKSSNRDPRSDPRITRFQCRHLRRKCPAPLRRKVTSGSQSIFVSREYYLCRISATELTE